MTTENEATPLIPGNVSPANIGQERANSVEAKTLPFRRCAIFCGLITLLGSVTFTSNLTTVSQYVHFRLSEQHHINVTPSGSDMPCSTNITSHDGKTIVQEETSRFMLLLAVTTNIPAIFVNVILGSCSDFLGRKVIFFVPLFGLFLRCVFSICIMHFVMDIQYLYLASVMDGLGGSMFAFLVASFAYTADITSTGRGRIVAVSVVDLCLALASAVSLLLSGYMISMVGYAILNVIMMCLILIGCLLILLLPETTQRRPMVDVSIKSFLKNSFGYYVQRTDDDKRTLYNLVLVIFMCMIMITFGQAGIEPVYALGRPFCFNSVQIGYFLCFKLVFVSIGSISAIKVLQRCVADEVIAVVGSVNAMVSLLLEGFADNGTTLFFVPLLGLVRGTTMAIARGTLSRLTPVHQQGAVFAGVAAFETLVNMISQILFNWIYSSTVETEKGSVFFVMAGVSGIATVFIFVWMYLSPKYRNVYTIHVSPKQDVSLAASEVIS